MVNGAAGQGSPKQNDDHPGNERTAIPVAVGNGLPEGFEGIKLGVDESFHRQIILIIPITGPAED